MTTSVSLSVSRLSGSPASTSADRVRSSAACTAATIVAPTLPLAPSTPTRIAAAYCDRFLRERPRLYGDTPRMTAFCARSSSRLTHTYFLNRPANPRSGRSALVIRPGRAATTDLIACSAGIPVTVMPMEAKLSGLDRSTPGFGKIMCLL